MMDGANELSKILSGKAKNMLEEHNEKSTGIGLEVRDETLHTGSAIFYLCITVAKYST
jgi:hypothetical protein